MAKGPGIIKYQPSIASPACIANPSTPQVGTLPFVVMKGWGSVECDSLEENIRAELRGTIGLLPDKESKGQTTVGLEKYC